MSKISLDVLEKTINSLTYIKTKTFWTHDLLSAKQKRMFHNEMTGFVLLQLFFWLLALAVIIASLAPNIHFSKFVYNDQWSLINKITFKICLLIFVSCGYFVGEATECYYVYIVLHNYFQMKILMAFMKAALAKYKCVRFDEKIFDGEYQVAVGEVLRRSIRHFQELKMCCRPLFSFVFIRTGLLGMASKLRQAAASLPLTTF